MPQTYENPRVLSKVDTTNPIKLFNQHLPSSVFVIIYIATTTRWQIDSVYVMEE